MSLRLNCDLGESARGNLEMETAVMPYIDQANIACGCHAGDVITMQGVTQLAKDYGVTVGAHPSYLDRENFGRLSISYQHNELVDLIHQQIKTLEGIAHSSGVTVDYVKPHGALYNDMMKNAAIRAAVMDAMASYSSVKFLMLQATPDSDKHKEEANGYGVAVWFEAFADRCYDDRGYLLSRDQPQAVHTVEKTLEQVELLCNRHCVITNSGRVLPVVADSLCIHGDNGPVVQYVGAIRKIIKNAK